MLFLAVVFDQRHSCKQISSLLFFFSQEVQERLQNSLERKPKDSAKIIDVLHEQNSTLVRISLRICSSFKNLVIVFVPILGSFYIPEVLSTSGVFRSPCHALGVLVWHSGHCA